MRILLTLGCCLALCSSAAFAQEWVAHPPIEYTVKAGDNLWDIAARYLKKPWHWEKIWKNNPHIKNPYQLQVGDKLVLHRHNQRFELQKESPFAQKVVAEMKVTEHHSLIPTLPLDTIRNFLPLSRIFSDEKVLAPYPYVTGFANNRTLEGGGDVAYVERLSAFPAREYLIMRPSRHFFAWNSKKLLGIEAIGLGQAERLSSKRVLLKNTRQPIQPGDRLIPLPKHLFHPHFALRAAHVGFSAHVIATFNSLMDFGPRDVVILDKGAEEGLMPGHTLDYLASERVTKDPVTQKSLLLPKRLLGEMVVFRTFPHLSFALIVHSIESGEVGQEVVPSI